MCIVSFSLILGFFFAFPSPSRTLPPPKPLCDSQFSNLSASKIIHPLELILFPYYTIDIGKEKLY